MGGKAKQTQRTKGNLRPANSTKALDGLDGVGLIPFGSSIVSGLTDDVLNIDSSVDPSFQMVLRKLNKKDPTTKIKALKEFTDLVNQSEVDIILTTMPFFPKIYVSLSCDVDARVREHSQTALFAIVSKIGKNLATILKQIFPAWLCGQYDQNPTAASIATKSFEVAFPAKKVSDVFAFCDSETIEYFTKNLIVLNAQTICNPKVYSTEECEDKYERVVISSLRGYALYLEKMSTETLEQSKTKNLALTQSERFWSLHKNKTLRIRSAFFEAISAILQHGSFLLANSEEQVTQIVFKAIDETDPVVLSHVWTCIVLVQAKIANWSQHINVNKMLLPKIWKILRTALYPCVIYPNLLPLISKFDKAMLPEKQLHSFYLRFFENIQYGLRNVQMSKAELKATCSAYYEVLQYITIQVVNEKEVDEAEINQLCLTLLDEHIIAVIFWCINSDSSFGKHIYQHIAKLLSYWCKNSQDVKIYDQLVNRFWSELYQVLNNSLETSSKIKDITNSHVELLKHLKNYSQNLKVKAARMIKFEDSPKRSANDNGNVTETGSLTYVQQLNELAFKVISIYLERISTSHEVDFIENFEILVKDYQSEELFRHLMKWNNPDEVNICSLYDTFSVWLMQEELRSEAIIEIILVLYKYIRPSEKIELLNRWIRVPFVQNWIIMRALSYPLCVEPDITKLLKMQEVTDHLVECAKQVSNGVCTENLVLLQKCFFQTEDGNILINTSTCERIVDTMCEPLSDEARIGQMDQCASFLAQIFPVICSDVEKTKLQRKIFLSLFEFSILNELSEHLSDDTLWEVGTAWQDALSSNDVVMDENLTDVCAKIIGDKIETISMDKMTIDGMKRLTEIVSKLILCSIEPKTSTEKSLLTEKLICKFLRQNDEYENYMENLGLLVASLNDEIIIDKPVLNSLNCKYSFLDALDNYVKCKIFNLEVIVKLSCNIKKKNEKKEVIDSAQMELGDEIEFSELVDQAQEDEEVTEDYFDEDENLLKEWTNEIYEKMLNVQYSTAVLNVIMTNSKFSLHPEIEMWILYATERMEVFMKNVTEKIANQLSEKLFERANVAGGLWAKCLISLLSTKNYSTENGIGLLYEDAVIHSNQSETMISYVNILKTFSEHIKKRSLPIASNLFENYSNLLVKISACRSLMKNHLAIEDFNEISDRKIVGNALIIMNEIITKQKAEPFLLYNKDVSLESDDNVLLSTEIALFLSDVLTYFPSEVDVKRWDFIRIALSSFVLSVSKSCENFSVNKVRVFNCAVFKLNSALFKFFSSEKTKSSTQILQNIMDEWDKVFAKEVNLVLIKSFIYIINNLDYESKHHEYFTDALCPSVAFIDFSYTLQSQKVDHTFSLKDLISFALTNISNKHREVCVTSSKILKQLTRGLIKFDQEILLQRESEDYSEKNNTDDSDIENNRWHILDTLTLTLENYQEVMKEFIDDFNFKLNEIDDLSSILPNIAFSYLLLWDCILNFCSKASSELRPIYVKWITAHNFEEVFLVSLFKLMPRDILRNPDASVKAGHAAFSSLEIKDSSVSNERYAAYLYAESLRTIPAVVRKWWHAANTRQAQLVERITQNYVSPILCQQDLAGLTSRKDKDGKDNMAIKVLIQSREVFATYSLEESKMELTISLPSNYPLGAIKIESTKHFAGKLQAREIVKQLSIYLTHQNGRLYDGISLWKRNLDRKYEGVEECFVCYSVINQDTCQLPRLTCKTCKKKFHSNCLYKWFTSSNKSTCPLCRNVF